VRVVGLTGLACGFCGVEDCSVEFVDEVFQEGDFLTELVEVAGVVVGMSGVGIVMGMRIRAVGVGMRGSEREGDGEEEEDREDSGEELRHGWY
jgi:hypothetical protein